MCYFSSHLFLIQAGRWALSRLNLLVAHLHGHAAKRSVLKYWISYLAWETGPTSLQAKKELWHLFHPSLRLFPDYSGSPVSPQRWQWVNQYTVSPLWRLQRGKKGNLYVHANYFTGLHVYALLTLELETRIQSLRTPGGWLWMRGTLALCLWSN